MESIRVTGVPEHFNLPWRVLADKQSKLNVPSFTWTENGSGTGAMCEALRSKEVDIALLLTEGAVKDIHFGNPSTIFSFYVDSPLLWGVHASSDISIDLRQTGNNPFAISRFTSGSHLMACVYAQSKGRYLEDEDFQVVNNLEGARNHMKGCNELFFMWEKFTTKYLVDSGEFVRLDECPTPWPAFSVVVRNEILDTRREDVVQLIQEVQRQAQMLRNRADIVDLLISDYRISKRDATDWLRSVRWSQTTDVDENILKNVYDHLASLDLVK